jgi:hypothetical protein
MGAQESRFFSPGNKPLSKRFRRVSAVLRNVPTVTEDKSNKYGLRSILADYCLNASPHGLLGIIRSQSRLNFFFWSLSFLIFIALMAYFVVSAIIDYFQYPTNMNVNVVTEWPQYFPAVSLCNASPLRMDLFMEPFLSYTNALNLTNTNDTTTLSAYQAQFIWNFLINGLNNNYSAASFFYSLSPMLYSCSFNSVPCSAADFISFTSSLYGMCYTFNAKLKNSSGSSVRYGNEYGGTGELDLGLYFYSNQYVPYVSDGE